VTGEYVCDACGKRAEPRGWLALRIAADRRGLEIRRFEYSGPDDSYVCGKACAFARMSEILAGARPLAGSEADPASPFHPPALRRAVDKLKRGER